MLDKIGIIEALSDVNFKDELTIEYMEFLMLKNSMYDKIELIENIKKAILSNANEDMQKTKFAIEIIKK